LRRAAVLIALLLPAVQQEREAELAADRSYAIVRDQAPMPLATVRPDRGVTLFITATRFGSLEPGTSPAEASVVAVCVVPNLQRLPVGASK
jgi:hypothetical protein